MLRLLEYDPDLAGDLRAERRHEACTSAHVRALDVPRGTWAGPEAIHQERPCPYGVLVLEGLVARTVMLGGDDACAQLLGRGDLLRPSGDRDEALVPVAVRWTVLEPLKLALLDEQFLFTVRRWPEIVAALFDRIAAQAVRVATHRAVSQLPRVEDRIHALLWFLAERWGRVTPQGVVLPLKLTHELLGQLVGAKRPTVTLAIKELEARGTVHRRGDGAWLLEQRWVREGAELELPGHGSAGFIASEIPPLAISKLAPPLHDEGEVNGNGNGHSNGTGEGLNGHHDQQQLPLPSLSEIRHRVERMRARHERSLSEADSVLARCAAAQQHSATLRDRIARRRHHRGA